MKINLKSLKVEERIFDQIKIMCAKKRYKIYAWVTEVLEKELKNIRSKEK